MICVCWGLFFFCELRVVLPQSIVVPIHSFSYLQRVAFIPMYTYDIWASQIRSDSFSLFCHSRFHSEDPPLILTNDFPFVKVSFVFWGGILLHSQ